MQLINLAKLVALVAIATPLVSHPIDRSALEVRTTTGIRSSPVTVNVIKRDEVAEAIEPIRTDLQQPARRSSDVMLAPRMDPFSIATIATTGVKALGGIAKGIKGWIGKHKAKKAAENTESEAAKRDLAAAADEPASSIAARAFDFVGFTNGIAQGAQAFGQIVQTFKDLKKGGRSGGGGGGGGGAAAAAAAPAAPADETASSDESPSPSTASDESASEPSASDESSAETWTSGGYKKRTVVVKRAAVWSA